MNNMDRSCDMCGQCCRFEIPITLLDINRMAECLKVTDQKVFDDYVQNKVSSRSSLFKIRKNKQGICLFLTIDKQCAIHPAKPRACQFYTCSLHGGEKIMPWTMAGIDESQHANLWEQSVAAEITKAYIRKNQTAWNAIDYHKAVKSIFDNIVVCATQKFKIGRDKKGNLLTMIYDCSRCKKRGTYAVETPVTLDDIRRVTSHLGLSWPVFFSMYVASEPGTNSGCLKLIRQQHCIFFHQERHCIIKNVRPMHCRFTPCPKLTKTNDMMDFLFLGSGKVEEQFRHQVAMDVTRQYVVECGTEYNKQVIKALLKKMDKVLCDHKELADFYRKLAPYRYIDETASIMKRSEKTLRA